MAGEYKKKDYKGDIPSPLAVWMGYLPRAPMMAMGGRRHKKSRKHRKGHKGRKH